MWEQHAGTLWLTESKTKWNCAARSCLPFSQWMNLHTARSSATRNETEREQDKRVRWWGGGRAERVDCVRMAEFLSWSMRHLYLVFVCVGAHVCVYVWDSIFRPRPPWSPFIQTLLLITHPNSLQPVAHDKTTEQNQISKRRCITVPRHHTESWLLKPWETKCIYSSTIYWADLQFWCKLPSNPGGGDLAVCTE